jgi:hypothetical protein
MTDAEPTTTDVVKTSADNNSNSNSRRGIALLFLLLISLLSLLRASSTLSKFYTENTSSSVVPLVTNYSIAIKAEAARSAAGTTYHQTSETLSIPIYLIDTSNTNHTNIAVSTWGNIAPHWNRTTEYSNLMNLATSVSSLPIDHNNKQQQPKIMVIIHCGPKVGSTTLRLACRKNFERTCPQINLIGKEGRARASPGYFGGIGEDTTRLISVMKECSVDTYYFCVNQISVWDMLPSTTTTLTEESIANESTTAMMTNQQQQQQQQTNSVQYLHLFPFRNYNDWVKSAIKQQYDRNGNNNGCNSAKQKWENGKCQHSQMEIDLRKYGRVDLDRFLDGVVKRMNSSNSNNGNDDDKLKERRGSGEEHTFLLYLHRDLHQVMKVVSTTYHIPMLPGLGTKKKGKRPERTCNESLVELYHECFSDGMMEFRWDLPENQVEK